MAEKVAFTDQLIHFKHLHKEFDFHDWIENKYHPELLDEFIMYLHSEINPKFDISTLFMRPVRELHVGQRG